MPSGVQGASYQRERVAEWTTEQSLKVLGNTSPKCSKKASPPDEGFSRNSLTAGNENGSRPLTCESIPRNHLVSRVFPQDLWNCHHGASESPPWMERCGFEAGDVRVTQKTFLFLVICRPKGREQRRTIRAVRARVAPSTAAAPWPRTPRTFPPGQPGWPAGERDRRAPRRRRAIRERSR